MTLKQLAERLGVTVKDLDIVPSAKCRACKSLGGSNTPTCNDCIITAFIVVTP